MRRRRRSDADLAEGVRADAVKVGSVFTMGSAAVW